MKQAKFFAQKRLAKIAVSMVVVAAILLSLHMLVNYTDLVPLLRRLHGG